MSEAHGLQMVSILKDRSSAPSSAIRRLLYRHPRSVSVDQLGEGSGPQTRPFCFGEASEGSASILDTKHEHRDADKDDQMHVELRLRRLELHRRRAAEGYVRSVRAAQRAGAEPFELEAQFGSGTAGFCIVTAGESMGQAIARRMAETEPCRSELQSPFFDGTVEEVETHNREVRRQSAVQHSVPTQPHKPRPTLSRSAPRPRQRRTCSSRFRGSRRGARRSYTRGGDGGDDPGGEPEPRSGPLRKIETFGAER